MGEGDRSSVIVGSNLGSKLTDPRKGMGLSPKAYQELKSTVHRDLLSRVDLEKVMTLGNGAARSQIFAVVQDLVGGLRSEERRVGKECRAWRTTDHWKEDDASKGR